MRFLCILNGLVFYLLFSSSILAQAEPLPSVKEQPVTELSQGTHFLAEVNGGGNINNDGGLAVGGLLGVGGKFRGWPLRFYLIGEYGYNTLAASGTMPQLALSYDEARNYHDLGLGLRIYLPLPFNLRLFVDGLGGATYDSATIERQGLLTVESGRWQALGQLATGLQLRLFHRLSLGLRAKMSFADEDPTLADLRQMLGDSSSIRTAISAGITYHF
jgi:hypothetical protein